MSLKEVFQGPKLPILVYYLKLNFKKNCLYITLLSCYDFLIFLGNERSVELNSAKHYFFAELACLS